MPSDPDADAEFMRRLREGDRNALNGLMERWEKPLRQFLYRWTHHEADSLDLAQETFVRVYRHQASFRTGAKFSTWLFSIAVNLCRDRARRAVTRPMVSWDDSGAELAEAEAAGTPGPEENLVRAETAEAVRKAVEALPEPLKATVLLCEYQELPQAEAASVLGCSPKAVETRLYRARQLLRERLMALR